MQTVLTKFSNSQISRAGSTATQHLVFGGLINETRQRRKQQLVLCTIHTTIGYIIQRTEYWTNTEYGQNNSSKLLSNIHCSMHIHK